MNGNGIVFDNMNCISGATLETISIQVIGIFVNTYNLARFVFFGQAHY